MKFPLLPRLRVVRVVAIGLALGGLSAPVVSHAQRYTDRSVRPAYDQWTTYLNQRFGFQVPVPPGLRAQSDPRKGSSCRFVSDEATFALKVWGADLDVRAGDPLEPAWREAINMKGRRITYQRRSAGGFVLVGTNAEGWEFYEKVIPGSGAVAGVNISYPAPLARRYAAWVDEIEDGFGWNTAGPEPVEVDEGPGGIFSGIRQYFTGEDRPPPSRYRNRSAPAPAPSWDPNGTIPSPPGPEESTPHDPSRTTVDLTPPPEKSRETVPQVPLETPDTAATPSAPSAPSPATKPAPVKREDLPYGIVIPGKKGFVFSPYVDDKQQVDVTDIPTGTKVKCPYTGKVFRVP